MAAPQLFTYFQNFNTDNQGQIALSGIKDIKDYSKINLEIIQYPTNVPNLRVTVHMSWTPFE